MKKDSVGIENIFIEYASVSLAKDPERFYGVLNEVASHFPMLQETSKLLKNQIELVIRFTECNDAKEGREFFEKVIKNPVKFENKYSKVELTSSFYYVYGEGGNCSACALWSERKSVFGASSAPFLKTSRCYECDQLYFAYILSEIINGKEYSEIVGFSNFISQGRHLIKTGGEIYPTHSDAPFKEELRKTVNWEQLSALNLQLFFRTMIAYSLVEFLLNDDRRKLKRCQECKKFYVSKTLRPSMYCSDKCRLAYHNRKRIKSGEAKEYKRKKREEGAKESYYG